MSLYRQHLPLNQGIPFVTDAGLETELIFKQRYELPEFASFPLLDSEQGCKDMQAYYQHYIHIARLHDTGLVLESPTWRASSSWGEKLKYSKEELDRVNHKAIAFLEALREEAGLDKTCNRQLKKLTGKQIHTPVIT